MKCNPIPEREDWFITDRKPTKYPRRFICLEIKTTKVRLHSYQAVKGKDTMKTFDVENYYG